MDYKVVYWDTAVSEDETVKVPREGIIKDVRRCVVETNGILKFELYALKASIIFNTDQWVHVAPFDSDMDKRVTSDHAINALYDLMTDWKYRYLPDFRNRINEILDILESPNI